MVRGEMCIRDSSDANEGAARVVLLSYEGWQSFFQGDPRVVGRTLMNGGQPATVIGVLPAGVRFPDISIAPSLVTQSLSLIHIC